MSVIVIIILLYLVAHLTILCSLDYIIITQYTPFVQCHVCFCTASRSLCLNFVQSIVIKDDPTLNIGVYTLCITVISSDFMYTYIHSAS